MTALPRLSPGRETRALAIGASDVALRSDVDFRSMVNDCTQGRGVDQVIDSTGGSILDQSFDCLRTLGHVGSYGEAEGKPYANLGERLVRKSLTITGLHIGHVGCRSDTWKNGAQNVMGLIASGTVRVPVEGAYDLEDASDTYQRLGPRSVAGRLLLRIGR